MAPSRHHGRSRLLPSSMQGWVGLGLPYQAYPTSTSFPRSNIPSQALSLSRVAVGQHRAFHSRQLTSGLPKKLKHDRKASLMRYATTASASQLPKARPGLLVLVPTFIFTHFTLAWALVPPTYLVFRNSNLGNTLLAGPQGAWLLSRKIPSWMPDVVIDGIIGAPANTDQDLQQQHTQLTVEEALERLVRRAVRASWKYAKFGGNALKMLRGTKAEEDELADDALRRIGGRAEGADQNQRGSALDEQVSGLKSKLKIYTRKQARNATDEIHFGHIRDALAAWVFVKILFPVRLPVSLFLTPRVARTLTKIFSRG